MFEKIYNKIKEYENIVIVRHIGADPDALASQLALRQSIKLTFPKKKVYAWGNVSNRFNYFPRLDKFEEIGDTLLIVVDTPDKKRIDFSWNIQVSESIKIDHHPYIETFCDIEYIDDTACSASQIIFELIMNTELKLNDDIGRMIYCGIVSDTNRFMFNPTSKVFKLVSLLLDNCNFDPSGVYEDLLSRPLAEARLQGYISQNFIITENQLAYLKISNDKLNELSVDVGSAGNMINNFNFIEGITVWVIVTEDIKNNLYKVNIRSRGPIINTIAEKYNGGGHKMASGARVKNMQDVDLLLNDLDEACKIYFEEKEVLDDED